MNVMIARIGRASGRGSKYRPRGRGPALLLSLLWCSLALLAPFSATPARAVDLLHYELIIRLDPEAGRLEATTAITVPPDYPRAFTIALHQELALQAGSPEVGLYPAGLPRPGDPALKFYRVELPPDSDTFALIYSGKIDHPPGFAGRDYARGVAYTPGRITPDGIYLSPAAAWYPFPTERPARVSFRLRVKLPEGWTAVSQGGRLKPRPEVTDNETVWEELNPQVGIFLVADRFAVYQSEAGGIATMAFLRRPDPKLADLYLDATARYLDLYSRMLGPYPYAKFALVENVWESGFGMPSFTLLGSRVIRLPFILQSSYPHEILHNWWGNGVYADYAAGNWHEGLTTYLSDHLLMAQKGRGAEYRRDILQKYRDYAARSHDFPLSDFTSRHDPASEAVGYGKGLMFFHMLRQELGEEKFLAALRDFYRRHLFRAASFDDLRAAFTRTTGRELAPFFAQWLERPGAPQLAVERVRVTRQEEGYRLFATFSQLQQGPPYSLTLPVAVTLAGREQPQHFRIALTAGRVSWQAEFDAKPLLMEVDPQFDLFRLPDRDELPPAFSGLYGAPRLLAILPGQTEDEAIAAGYRELAAALHRFGSAAIEIVQDYEIEELPPDRAVLVLGWENAFSDKLPPLLRERDAELTPTFLRIGEQLYSRAGHAVALALPSPAAPDQTLGFIAADQAGMFANLIRRLPHYHRYSALIFQGAEAENILHRQWPVTGSPLYIPLNGD